MCRDTLAGLPGLSFCRYRLRGIRDNLNMLVHFRRERNMPGPPSAIPRYSKMCRYFFAGNATCRVPPAVPGTAKCAGDFCRECNMPEIDANEVNQLASLTGRTVGFATSSEGDGCTRTRHRHLGGRGPCPTFSTGVPIRSALCWAAHARRCGQVAGVGLHGCRPPNKNGSAEEEPAPNQKISETNGPHSTEKKKVLQNEKKTLERRKKNLFGRKRTPHLDLIELHIISQTTRPVKKCTKSRQSIIPVLFCRDFNMPVLFGRYPVLYGTFLSGLQYAGTLWAVSGTRKSRGFIRALVPFIRVF